MHASGVRPQGQTDREWPVVCKTEDRTFVLEDFPRINSGFIEASTVEFHVTNAAGGVLHIDDEPLPCQQHGRDRLFSWSPGFYAGEVRLDLLNAVGEKTSSWRLDVSPDPRKLGADAMRQMFADIQKFESSLLAGTEPPRTRMGALGESDSPFVALERIRSRMEAIKQALRALYREPSRYMRPRRDIVPLNRVRKLDPATIRSIVRHPRAVAATVEFGVGHQEVHVPEPRIEIGSAEHSFDSSAYRSLLAYLRALDFRCRCLQETLLKRVISEEESETRSSLKTRWPMWARDLQSMRQSLEIAQRQTPFRDVTRAEISSAGLTAIAAHPIHSYVQRLVSQALRTGIDGEGAGDSIALSPSWEIYERWCFVELSTFLSREFPDFLWSRKDATHLIGEKDRTRLSLTLQPQFSCSNGEEHSGFWSLSRQRTPDIVLDFVSESRREFLVMDAKYRVSRLNVLDAMSSAHIYQDSLRFGESRPVASVLLVPAKGGAPWLESQETILKNKVGVIELSPGVSLPEWFLQWVRRLCR